MPAIRAPGRQSRNVTNRPTPPITHRYNYFAGTLYQAAGQIEQSIALYQQVLGTTERVLGPNNPATQAVRARLDSLMH